MQHMYNFKNPVTQACASFLSEQFEYKQDYFRLKIDGVIGQKRKKRDRIVKKR